MKVKSVHWLGGEPHPSGQACRRCAHVGVNDACHEFLCLPHSHRDNLPRIAVDPEDHAKVAELRLTGLIGPYLD